MEVDSEATPAEIANNATQRNTIQVSKSSSVLQK